MDIRSNFLHQTYVLEQVMAGELQDKSGWLIEQRFGAKIRKSEKGFSLETYD